MNEQEKNVLYGLIDRYWKDWTSYWKNNLKYQDIPESDPYVVYPAIPIIWFGNINEYWESSKKIVTVAINPSTHEFSENGEPPYSVNLRFKDAKDLVKNGQSVDSEHLNRESLIQAYNNYFKNEPYPDFFSAFERVLQNLPIVASYGDRGHKPKYLYGTKNNPGEYKKHDCTAIHIDCETAIATRYLWEAEKKKFRKGTSKNEFNKVKKILSKKETKRRSEKVFNDLFMDFLKFLKPDIVIVSSKISRDVLAWKVKSNEGKRLKVEDFDNPAKNEDHNYRVSYQLDDQLWIYGRNNTGPGPFFLLTGKGTEEEKEKNRIKNEKIEKRFLEESFEACRIKV